MFDHLDDPDPFDPSGAFRSGVESRARLIRRRRRTRRMAAGCGAAVSLSAGIVAVRAADRSGSVEIIATDTTADTTPPTVFQSVPIPTDEPTTSGVVTTAEESASTLPAQNFLIAGSDDRSCIDPNSPYAGAFLGDGTDVGSRSDTIMLIHVDPKTDEVAILSFPRDLWVSIAGSNKKSRINAAFDPQNPQKLIDTIVLNFYVPIDHYIQVDFCAFKDIVDAVGGVAVPFAFPARDKNTGLNIEVPECRTMGGDEALAYVRSRHYQYFDPSENQWVTDGTGDYGRITRQQDFLKRTIAKVLDRATSSPLVVRDIVEAGLHNIVTDSGLTVGAMIELGEALVGTDASTIRQFQIEGKGVKKGNASVIEPVTDTETMQYVLALFRGLPVAAPPTSSSAPGDSTQPVDDQLKGIYPPDDPTCR